MKAIDKPHVYDAVTSAMSVGAKIDDDTKAKVVAMSLEGSRFFVIGNDVEPTFAFHPKLKLEFLSRGIQFEGGRHSGLSEFPKALGSSQFECLRVEKAHAMRALREVLA